MLGGLTGSYCEALHSGIAVLCCVRHFAVLGFAFMLQPFDYGPAVFVPFPVLVYAILGMRTELVGLRGVVLQYGTDLFAGLWHSCCLGSVLTLVTSFLPILGAIVALHQLSLLLSPGASVEPHGHVTHPGTLEASAMLEFSCLRCILLECHNMYLLAVAYMYSFWP